MRDLPELSQAQSADPSLVRWAHVIYGLHAIAVIVGVASAAATVAGGAMALGHRGGGAITAGHGVDPGAAQGRPDLNRPPTGCRWAAAPDPGSFWYQKLTFLSKIDPGFLR